MFTRCPTCREWNTVQEFRVNRGGGGTVGGSASSNSRPIFGGGRDSGHRAPRHLSWLDGVDSVDAYAPVVPITDVYKKLGYDGKPGTDFLLKEQRLRIPEDEELNNVLGGGVMPGSLTLLGGDPGVGKVRA